MNALDEEIADLQHEGFVLPDVVRWAPGYISPEGTQVPGHWEMQEAQKPATKDRGRKWFCVTYQRAHDLIAMDFARQYQERLDKEARGKYQWLGRNSFYIIRGDAEAAIDALWEAVCDA